MPNIDYYAQTCDVYCTDTEVTIEAEVLDFVPEKFLRVSLDRSVILTLRYNKPTKIYVTHMGGLEFQSNGPDKLT